MTVEQKQAVVTEVINEAFNNGKQKITFSFFKNIGT